MMFIIDSPRSRRKPSLTPMIDVVFLLLVFFMLASRFGSDALVPLSLGGSGDTYSGPPPSDRRAARRTKAEWPGAKS